MAVQKSVESNSLADILERVLDKGIVIAGDITVSIADVELLTIKIRLVVCSVDKAQEIGINWWKSDPALCSEVKKEDDEIKKLKQENEEIKRQEEIKRLKEENEQLQKKLKQRNYYE